ncbi:MAG TPA: response regulator [Chloroflexia bacterium]|nr:response regulator [Chloroflexia bacterium]
MHEASHILVVDDDEGTCKLVERILLKQGYRVTTTTNPLEVERLVLTQDFKLIILGLIMPVLDGNAILQRLAARGDKTLVIVMSGNLPRLLPTTQVVATLSKPFQVAQVTGLVKQFA